MLSNDKKIHVENNCIILQTCLYLPSLKTRAFPVSHEQIHYQHHQHNIIILITGTPDSPNGIDYELYVTKKVWTKTVGGEDVIADRIFHYHQVSS